MLPLSVVLFLGLLCFSARSQNRLNVNRPNWGTWTTYNNQPGKITEATIAVRPKGMYMEVGLYLTIGLAQQSWQSFNNLELVLDFGLPVDAIIHDSWLWIDDDIIRADILDIQSASAIYNSVVVRNQDPSILKQVAPGQYQLRIFPVGGLAPRKVKISYLMPVNWKSNAVAIDLPVDILRTSFTAIPDIKLKVWQEWPWTNPRIIPGWDGTPIELSPTENATLGNHLVANLDWNDLKYGLSLEVDAPFENGIFFSKNTEEQMYQLVALPQQILPIEPPTDSRKVVVALGMNPGNTNNMTIMETLTAIKQTLINELNDGDKFNFILNNTQKVSNEWLPANEQTISLVMNLLISNPEIIQNTFNTITTLQTASLFIIANEQGGDIVLIKNMNNGCCFPGPILENLVFQNSTINILDFQNQNFSGIGMEFNNIFSNSLNTYKNLVDYTGGVLVYSGNFVHKFKQILNHLDSFKGYIEIQPLGIDGFSYDSQHLGGINNNRLFRQPLRQVGRYFGQIPSSILINAVANGSGFSEDIPIDPVEIYPSDSMVREIWAGNYIHALEGQASSNSTIQQVIQTSLEERALSAFTAFLCLEPSQGGEPCEDCIDESSETVGVTELTMPAISLLATPNPFTDQVTIKIAGLQSNDSYQASIYNAMGQNVKSFGALTPGINGELTIIWDGRNNQGIVLPAGIYFFVIQGSEGRAVVKLVKG